MCNPSPSRLLLITLAACSTRTSRRTQGGGILRVRTFVPFRPYAVDEVLDHCQLICTTSESEETWHSMSLVWLLSMQYTMLGRRADQRSAVHYFWEARRMEVIPDRSCWYTFGIVQHKHLHCGLTAPAPRDCRTTDNRTLSCHRRGVLHVHATSVVSCLFEGWSVNLLVGCLQT